MDTCIELSYPGSGPMGPAGGAPGMSLEFEKFNSSFDLSLRSISDYNVFRQQEGNITSVYKAPENREGIYAKDTDRGELSPTIETQMNLVGPRSFESRLQDELRPTTKETTLHTYAGALAPVTKAHALYTQFVPKYANINGKTVRISGASNYSLRAATEYSHFNGAGPTSINASVVQNPDVVISNLWKRPDNHVDGPGTFNDARADMTKFQQYKRPQKHSSSGLKLNHNLENQTVYSSILDKNVSGIEGRHTTGYQLAPLFSNPLSVIWNPSGHGELPEFNVMSAPDDYSYSNMTHLPEDEYVYGSDNSNSYLLGFSPGIHNERIEWSHGLNDRQGINYIA